MTTPNAQTANPSSAASATADFTLSRGRAGQLQIWMTVDQVVALYGQQAITPVDLHLEGESSPALQIQLDGATISHPSIIAEQFPPTPDRIWRVTVYDPRFRTNDGLGVGSTLADIRSKQNVVIEIGEGSVYGYAAALEMSFDFGGQWYPWTDLPPDATAQSVLIVVPPGEWMPR